ncbi:biliverdin-producing heme oxygenase [Brevibacterium sp. UMB10442]|nr:biliverdin-producing heme oxygenase [Brevibacterium sp. UMB10442]
MTITTPTAETLSFSQRLRKETQREHSEAESERFIVDLMAGRLDRNAYIALLEQYAVLYPALESAVQAASAGSVLAMFDHPGLARTQAINDDLDQLLGSDRQPPVALEATRFLAEHFQSEVSPEQLLAHHYLRYLGDLSGGLAIGKLVKRHYSIEDEALNMWRFPGINKPKLFKDDYRAKLDAVTLTREQQEAVIAEAELGFRLNKAIFRQLGETLHVE